MTFTRLLLPPMLAIALLGCNGSSDDTDTDSDSDTDTDTDTDTGTDTFGYVRLAHFGVFAQGANANVQVFLNDEPAVGPIDFKQTTTYNELPTGTYKVDIVPEGGGIGDSVFTVPAFELGANETWSVAAVGYPAPPQTGDNAFTLLAFQDDASDIELGQLRLNVVHAAPAAAFDPVDVWLLDDDCAPIGATPLIAGFAFGAQSGNLDIPAGAFNVGLDVGADQEVDACFKVPATVSDELVVVYAVNDPAGAVSLVAHLPDGSPAEILPFDPGTGLVRLTHLGVFPEGADSAVDIFINGEASGITLSFEDTTDYVELAGGTYTFDVVPAGGVIGDSVFTVEDFEIVDGDVWSVYASGYVAPASGDNGFAVQAFRNDDSAIPAGQIRLNVVHAAPLGDLDPVDVWAIDERCNPVGEAPLLAAFAFGEASGNLDLPAGPRGIGFDVGADGDVDACVQVPDLGADALIDVYAANDAAGDVFLLAHLPNGSAARVDATPPPSGDIRLVHLGVFPGDSGTEVDIFINGARSGVRFSFLEATDYITLREGTYDFDVVPSGGVIGDSVFTVEDFEVTEGSRKTIYASGYTSPGAGDQGFGVSAFDDPTLGIAEGNVRINAIHAAAAFGLRSVDVWLTDSSCNPADPLLPGFTYAAREAFDLEPGPLSLGLDANGDGRPDACFNVPELDPDQLVNVFAVNNSAGAVKLVAHQADGEVVVLDSTR